MKVACHVHSEWSYDGQWTLPDLAREFRRRGHRIVMLTEHDRGFTEARWLDYQAACLRASTEGILLVPGIEYSDPENIVHVLVWGRLPFLGERLPTSELLHRVRSLGGVAVMAHLSRRAAWKVFDPAWIADLHGIEVWNFKTDGWAPSETASGLAGNTGILEFVGMDFHDRPQFFPLSMEMTLEGGITEEALLEALQARLAWPHAFDAPLHLATSGWRGFGLREAERIRRRLRRFRKLRRFYHRVLEARARF